MSEILTFLFPLFSTSRNYGETLSKLAGFALYETFFIALYLRHIPKIDRFFSSFDGALVVAKSPLIAPIAVAVVCALLSRAFKLHDLISDILGIRRRFDVAHILMPLADLVGFKPSLAQRQSIKTQRDSLMRSVFYKYASSRSDSPLVDKHEIEHAIDAWAWFWWPVEAVVFLLVATVIAVCLGAYGSGGVLAIAALVALVMSIAMYPRLKRLALPQVEAIAANTAARQDVLAHFNAL